MPATTPHNATPEHAQIKHNKSTPYRSTPNKPHSLPEALQVADAVGVAGGVKVVHRLAHLETALQGQSGRIVRRTYVGGKEKRGRERDV